MQQVVIPASTCSSTKIVYKGKEIKKRPWLQDAAGAALFGLISLEDGIRFYAALRALSM